MSQRVVALLCAAGFLALSAAPAYAAGGAELTEAGGKPFPSKTFVLTLPERRALSADDVKVSENGQDVQALQVVPGDAAGAKTFAAMLVIDTSQSMQGAPVAAAMQAAREFAQRRPAQQRLGVVFFNRDATVALRPTTDAAKIQEVLAAPPPLSKGTQIYDAAAVALRELASAGVSAGSVVVLSDGADVGSDLQPSAVADAARRSHTRVFTIGLRSRSFDGSTLRQLAAASGGRYSEASERELGPLFAALGSQFGNEYLVTYTSLSPLGQKVAVSATVKGLAAPAAADYTTPAFQASAGSRRAGSGFAGSNTALAIAAVLAAALLGLGVFFAIRPGRRTLQTRIADFTATDVDDARAFEQAQFQAAADSGSGAGRLESSSWWIAFTEDIDVARFSISAERIAVLTLSGTAAAVVAAAVAGNAFLAVLLVAVPWIVRAVVRSRAGRQRLAFEQQLADNLRVIASAMRAGQSFVGALAVAVDDAAEPARRELHRTVTDERLGVPLDEAIGRTAQRMRSEELEYVGLVATLQRDTGGNTAEVIDRVTETIRERAELKGLVRTLTAQGRLGGAIVSALPVILVFFFAATQPGYFNPMLDTGVGRFLIVLGVLMLGAGWFAIRKIVDIKV
jgi:tight adherence protein B